MTNYDISSMNGAAILINIWSPGFNITCSFGEKIVDLFNKVKHGSLELITPSDSNMFFMPRTRTNIFMYI